MSFEKLRQFLLRNKARAETLLFMLSLLALALFTSNEIVAANPEALPIDAASWSSIQLGARMIVWASFVAHFVSYGLLSSNPWRYARDHLTELLICLAWFPHGSSLLHSFSTLLSLETVQLIGTLANGYVVVRHIVRNLSSHPLLVTGSVFLFVIVSAAELLMYVEPQTFTNLFDSIWYAMVTATTIGYGDIVPKTVVGRTIGMVLMVAGISLAGAFIGIVSQFMQSRIGQNQENKELERVKAELAEQKLLSERVLEALEQDRQLKQELIELLKKPALPAQKAKEEGQEGA